MKWPMLFMITLCWFLLSCGGDPKMDAPQPPTNEKGDSYYFRGSIDGTYYEAEFQKNAPLVGNINACPRPGELWEPDTLIQWAICQPNGFLPNGFFFTILSEPMRKADKDNVDIIKSRWPIGENPAGIGNWTDAGMGFRISNDNGTFLGEKKSDQIIRITAIDGPLFNSSNQEILEVCGTVNFNGTNDNGTIEVKDMEFYTWLILTDL